MNHAAGPNDRPTGSDLITMHYPLVLRLVGAMARRHRLSADETDELRSLVNLKLVEDDGSVLRRFEGRSTLSTYLTKVIWRVWLDRRIAAWGKWRPSTEARRQGPTALRLERLLHRDGLPFDEACARLLGFGRVRETREDLERMRDSFPQRHRVRFYGQDVLDALPGSALPVAFPVFDDNEEPEHQRRRRLAGALVSLPRTDRRLLRLRYREGWTIARVARELRLDQKRTYREFDRVHRTLRTILTDPRPAALARRRSAPAADARLRRSA